MASTGRRLRSTIGRKVGMSLVYRQKIATGMATSAPPLGPQVGGYGVNIKKFCDTFNKQTDHMKPGQPISADVTVHPDRSFSIKHYWPSSHHLILAAAGVSKGTGYNGHEWVGAINMKQVYHIAESKILNDERCKRISHEDMCRSVMAQADKIGIAVVKQ